MRPSHIHAKRLLELTERRQQENATDSLDDHIFVPDDARSPTYNRIPEYDLRDEAVNKMRRGTWNL